MLFLVAGIIVFQLYSHGFLKSKPVGPQAQVLGRIESIRDGAIVVQYYLLRPNLEKFPELKEFSESSGSKAKRLTILVNSKTVWTALDPPTKRKPQERRLKPFSVKVGNEISAVGRLGTNGRLVAEKILVYPD